VNPQKEVILSMMQSATGPGGMYGCVARDDGTLLLKLLSKRTTDVAELPLDMLRLAELSEVIMIVTCKGPTATYRGGHLGMSGDEDVEVKIVKCRYAPEMIGKVYRRTKVGEWVIWEIPAEPGEIAGDRDQQRSFWMTTNLRMTPSEWDQWMVRAKVLVSDAVLREKYRITLKDANRMCSYKGDAFPVAQLRTALDEMDFRLIELKLSCRQKGITPSRLPEVRHVSNLLKKIQAAWEKFPQ